MDGRLLCTGRPWVIDWPAPTRWGALPQRAAVTATCTRGGRRSAFQSAFRRPQRDGVGGDARAQIELRMSAIERGPRLCRYDE